MGYARHIGRVGALALTLGVGVAIATTPGVAFADSADSSTGDSSSSDSSAPSAGISSAAGTSAPGDAGVTDGNVDTAGAAEQDDSGEDPAAEEDGEEVDDEEADDEEADDEDTVDDDAGAEDETDDVGTEDETDDAGAVDETDDAGAEIEPGDISPSDGGDPPAATRSTIDDNESSPDTGDATTPGPSTGPPDTDTDADEPDQPGGTAAQHFDTASVTDVPATLFTARTSDDVVTLAATTTAPVAPPAAPRPTNLVTVVADLVTAVLKPFLSWGTGTPFGGPVLLAALAAARNELERMLFPQAAKVVAQQSTSQAVDPTKRRVLVIGVDGANLSRILADPENDNFLKLIEGSTNSAPSIVGHTTISNPSWSAILTGEWGEKTGVINNVFTPWTYDKFPTVFNQLETLEAPDQDIVTKAIANWNIINAIAAAGSDPVDHNVYIAQVEGDTNWLATDDRVGQETLDALRGVDGPVPNFLFSYFVGVDENGHLYGGASEQYAEAIRNVDDNLGLIMTEVDAWNATHSDDEDWTVIVVTDHGHQPQQGFGHGFQSPDETETFVIARGSSFTPGAINLDYEIVDTTPTVVSLFGGTPRPGSDGVPLTSLAGSTSGPLTSAQLRAALEEQIASNRSPDLLTQFRLGARTVFATIPYLVYTEFGAVPILGDALYVVTNVPAQIVAFLTGVQGASISPLLPPPPPSFPSEESTTMTADCAGPDAQTCVAV